MRRRLACVCCQKPRFCSSVLRKLNASTRAAAWSDARPRLRAPVVERASWLLQQRWLRARCCKASSRGAWAWPLSRVLTFPMSCTDCDPGYYLFYNPNTGVQQLCCQCFAGQYQPSCAFPYSCTACPSGTYNPSTGSTSSAACLPCPAGTFYSYAGGSSLQACIACVSPNYCFPAGCPGQSPCPAGSYCPSVAQDKQGCPINDYCPALTQVPIPCQQGYLCDSTGLTQELPCPSGHFCPTSEQDIPCPAGTFSSATGAYRLCTMSQPPWRWRTRSSHPLVTLSSQANRQNRHAFLACHRRAAPLALLFQLKPHQSPPLRSWLTLAQPSRPSSLFFSASAEFTP